MSLGRAGPQGPGTRGSGFTLLELLVTLALFCLIATVSLPLVMRSPGAVGLEADARMLAARLRLAREMALSTRAGATVTIDLVLPEVRGPGAEKAYRLSSTQRLRVASAKGPARDRTVDIAFAPDGSSSGGTVVLESGPLVRSVRVDWLTGVVRVSAAGP